jgi:hypothetical protein
MWRGRASCSTAFLTTHKNSWLTKNDTKPVTLQSTSDSSCLAWSWLMQMDLRQWSLLSEFQTVRMIWVWVAFLFSVLKNLRIIICFVEFYNRISAHRQGMQEVKLTTDCCYFTCTTNPRKHLMKVQICRLRVVIAEMIMWLKMMEHQLTEY